MVSSFLIDSSKEGISVTPWGWPPRGQHAGDDFGGHVVKAEGGADLDALDIGDGTASSISWAISMPSARAASGVSAWAMRSNDFLGA